MIITFIELFENGEFFTLDPRKEIKNAKKLEKKNHKFRRIFLKKSSKKGKKKSIVLKSSKFFLVYWPAKKNQSFDFFVTSSKFGNFFENFFSKNFFENFWKKKFLIFFQIICEAFVRIHKKPLWGLPYMVKFVIGPFSQYTLQFLFSNHFKSRSLQERNTAITPILVSKLFHSEADVFYFCSWKKIFLFCSFDWYISNICKRCCP